MGTTSEPDFNYYALHYFLQWERSEKSLSANLAKPDAGPDDLRKAMHAFRIARNFKGIGEGTRREEVLSALRNAGNSGAASVEILAQEFANAFNENISAASKLLWLVHRRPFLIYDSRAVTALERSGCTFQTRDYADFEKAWRSEYVKHADAIEAAVAELPRLQAFTRHWHPSESSIRELAEQPWFRERVFDLYLWEKGAKKEKKDQRRMDSET